MTFVEGLLKYGPLGVVGITFVISLLKPENTLIPKDVTPKTRAAIAAALAIVQEVLMSLDGQMTAKNATAIAAISALAAFGIHGVTGNAGDNKTGTGSSVKPPPMIPAAVDTTSAVVKDA